MRFNSTLTGIIDYFQEEAKVKAEAEKTKAEAEKADKAKKDVSDSIFHIDRI